MIEQTREQRRHALAFNAVAPALKEHDQWLPLSAREAVAKAVLFALDSGGGQPLVQVGWYCWRCHGVVAQACRSDNVPVHVPVEWEQDMAREISEQEEEDEDDTPENGAWHAVWLEGKWSWITSRMTTVQREYAADRVAAYSRYLAACDNELGRGEPEGLRWWREAA